MILLLIGGGGNYSDQKQFLIISDTNTTKMSISSAGKDKQVFILKTCSQRLVDTRNVIEKPGHVF